MAVRVVRQQRRNGFRAQVLPYLGVAEVVGDANQQFLEQEVELCRVVAQIAHVVINGVDLVDRHAPLCAPLEGIGLVLGEVIATTIAQQDDDLLKGALHLGLRGRVCLHRKCRTGQMVGNQSGQHLGGGNQVGHPGFDGAPWHAIGLRTGRFLHQCQPAFLFDGAQPEDTIGAHAGENDADRLLAAVFSQ